MNRTAIALGLIYLSSMTVIGRVNAQTVVSDRTLNTQVTQAGNTFTINNGTTSGNNLFHSFREFSIPTGGSALFDNATHIQNIFSRVTGGSISNIDGILSANGSANLFLLNPNGILFGSNAQLNIGGSFIGATAQAIQFADGTEFSANQSATPLLTMSTPIGLQMGQNPGAIRVQNQGHSFATNDPFSPIPYGQALSGLSVQPKQAIALIGGDIALDGGILIANEGHLELGTAKAGLVTLNLASPDLSLNYQNANPTGNIHLTQSSLLDTSGTRGGSITLQSEQITIADGSLLLIQNRGIDPSGSIRVNASKNLTLQGVSSDQTSAAGLLTETISTGKGGDVFITANNVAINGGGIVYTRLFDAGWGGNISIQATDAIALPGVEPGVSLYNSTILADSFGAGRAGNISLTSRKLLGLQGGYAGSAAFADGNAGDIAINADDIEFKGVDFASVSVSGTGSLSFGFGNAGTLTINTQRLSILDGAWVDNSSLAYGNGGNVIINAVESVLVSGFSSEFDVPSNISASARISNQSLQDSLKLPPVPTGKAGSVTVTTGQLVVTDGATISVQNDGQEDAGTLTLNARSIFLNQRGSISAKTAFGQGGNIQIQTDLLSLRNESRIITTAGGASNGGNIVINAPILLGLENSDIVANAARGRGGNIQITTQGMIGLRNRDRLTSESDITASSEFGVNGSVQVNIIGVDPNAGLIELSEDLVDDNQQVAAGCVPNQGSSFVITGRGGVLESPSDRTHPRPWSDLRAAVQIPQGSHSDTRQVSVVESAPVLAEATKWERDANGKIQLIAEQPVPNTITATCASN